MNKDAYTRDYCATNSKRLRIRAWAPSFPAQLPATTFQRFFELVLEIEQNRTKKLALRR